LLYESDDDEDEDEDDDEEPAPGTISMYSIVRLLHCIKCVYLLNLKC
jgi:hypothetical protein